MFFFFSLQITGLVRQTAQQHQQQRQQQKGMCTVEGGRGILLGQDNVGIDRLRAFSQCNCVVHMRGFIFTVGMTSISYSFYLLSFKDPVKNNRGCYLVIVVYRQTKVLFCFYQLRGEDRVAGTFFLYSNGEKFFYSPPSLAKIATLIENWQHLLLSITLKSFASIQLHFVFFPHVFFILTFLTNRSDPFSFKRKFTAK